MRIAFRLSIVIGIGMTCWVLVDMYVRYNNFVSNQIKENYRI